MHNFNRGEGDMKRSIKILLVLAVSAAMGGCAAQMVRPQEVRSHVDPISVHDPVQFEADVNECTGYADQAMHEANKRALLAALIGGLAGAAVGSAVGSGTGYRSNFAAAGAVGGASGAATGAIVQGANRKEAIIYNCLVNRGYRILY